jgi:hypothetical protein
MQLKCPLEGRLEDAEMALTALQSVVGDIVDFNKLADLLKGKDRGNSKINIQIQTLALKIQPRKTLPLLLSHLLVGMFTTPMTLFLRSRLRTPQRLAYSILP